MANRGMGRIGAVATAALVTFALLVAVPGGASAIDSGDVDLAAPPNLNHGCEAMPTVVDMHGNFAPVATGELTCTVFQTGQAMTLGSRLSGYVPANGTITSVRVRTGANPAPLRFTVMRQITLIRPDGTLDSGNSSCCFLQHMTQSFRLPPNAVTEVPLNLRVENGRDNVNRVAVSDILGVSADSGAGNLPIRVVVDRPSGPNVADSNVPGMPIMGWFRPQLAPGEPFRTGMTGVPGFQLTMNFSFCASGASSGASGAAGSARQESGLTRCGGRVTPRNLRSTPNVKAVRVPVSCTNGVACRGEVRVTTRGKKKQMLGRATYVVPGGATQRVRVVLNKRGRQHVQKRVRTQARVVVTAGGTPNFARQVFLVRNRITTKNLRSTPNRKAIRMPVSCLKGSTCRGIVRITTRGAKKQVLGRSNYVVKPWGTKQIRVQLNKRGRQALRQRVRTQARVAVTVRGAANHQRPVVLVRRGR